MPFLISKKGFDSQTNLLKSWETFQPEVLNQKVCRLLLSVHKKSSRLAVLSELGRYPVFLPALKQVIKYQYHVENMDKSTLIYKTLYDMEINPQLDTWYSRVEKIKGLLKINRFWYKPEKVGLIIDKTIQSKFDRFFIEEIYQKNLDMMGVIITN